MKNFFTKPLQIILFGCLFVLLAVSCGNSGSGETLSEGVIVYEVSFPFDQDNPYINIYPEEMTLYFKKGKVRAKLASFAEVVVSEIILDNEDQTYSQYFKMFDEKYALHLDAEGVGDLIQTMPAVNLKMVEKKDSLAGYMCDIYNASFLQGTNGDFSVKSTADIQIENPNWYNQFSQCEGVLMQYELEQFGKRMRLIAKEVRSEKVPDKMFKKPRGYEKVNIKQMEDQIVGLIAQFEE